jgi:hypothetical protein
MPNDEQWLCIPLSSIPMLTAEEVQGPNADVRKVFYALAEAMYDSYRSKLPNQLPARMEMRRQTSANVNQIDRAYNFSFETFIDAAEVAPEDA